MMDKQKIDRRPEKIRDILCDHLPYLIMFILANLIVYHDYWLGIRIFTGKDFIKQMVPVINYQTDCFRESSWPLWNPFVNFGSPWVDHYMNSSLFPTHLFMGIFTGSTIEIVQREILVWMIIGAFGVYLCVREFGFSGMAGFIAGTSFMFSSQLICLGGWSIQAYNACLFPYWMFGYHRARNTGYPLSLTSVLFMAMSVTGGYVTSAVLGMYFFIIYVILDSLLNKKFLFGIKYLSLTIGLFAMVSLPKLLPLYLSMGAGPRMAVSQFSQDAFNTINFYNFLSLLIPVKYYFSVYIGQLCVIGFVYALLKKKLRADALLVLIVLSAWLLKVDSNGNISALRSLSYALPFMNLVRNEYLYWYYPSVFAILYLARYFDGFLSENSRNTLFGAVGIYIILLSIFFFAEYNIGSYYKAYIFHFMFAFLWLSAAFLYRRRKMQVVFATLLLIAEFFVFFNRVDVNGFYKKYGNAAEISLTDQWAAVRSYEEGANVDSGMNEKIRILQDGLRPSISDSRNWAYLVPAFDVMNDSYYTVELLNQKRFAGWWYNLQESYEFLKLKDSPLIQTLDNQPLFVYLDRMTGEPVGISSFDKISCSSFDFTVKSDSHGFLLLHQMYDPRWKVFVDNSEQKIQRAKEFFMGVETGPGKHKVEFVFSDKLFNIALIISAVTLFGVLTVLIMRIVKGTDTPKT